MKSANSLILLPLLMAIFLNCAEDPYAEYDGFPFWMYFMYPTYGTRVSEYEQVNLTDRLDGSILIERVRLPGNEYVYRTLVQKCPQGYTYDSYHHECNYQGEGDSLQYCQANTQECNAASGELIGPEPKSEAFASCAGDNELGLTWQVTEARIINDLMRHDRRDEVFPILGQRWFWSNEAVSATTVGVYRSTFLSELRAKTERHSVYCQYTGGFY